MKKHLLCIVASLLAAVGVNAQDWSVLLTGVNGLPGVETTFAAGEYYKFASPVYELGTTTQTIRIIVLDTKNHEQPNGNNYCFALSELAVYDAEGTKVNYIASSNADHNNLSWISDGDGLLALSDGDYSTYFHSMWASYGAVPDYHYIQLSLVKPVSAFSLEWGTRANEDKNAPIKVAVTLGDDYNPSELGGEFELGDVVTTASEIAQQGQLFVMKSNTVTSFTTSNGGKFTGSGPVYLNCAESGTADATFANAVQFIAMGDGKYLVYWPAAGLFLKNSGADYNGFNGWQYSTSSLDEAAVVSITPLASGDFELSYTSTYNVTTTEGTNAVTNLLYVGADMRDNVESKTKTFAPDKKEALENENYDAGFSLPVGFDWTIYKANLYDETVSSVAISMSQLAQVRLASAVTEANGYIAEYGDFDGTCSQAVIDNLNSAINVANQLMAAGSSPTMAQIDDAAKALQTAMVNYMISKLDYYQTLVATLLAESEFSTYPYVTNTYPESSRAMLESLAASIADAVGKTNVYAADHFVKLYAQYDTEIARFHSTKIAYRTLPISYGAADGLPGSVESYGGYVWDTGLVTLNRSTSGVRLTFLASTDALQLYEGYPMISLGEIKILDGEGNPLALTKSSFATNSQELSEGPIANICDGDYSTYWHSIWKSGTMNPVGEVYLDITFPAPMQTFTIALYGRDNAVLFPTEITMSALGSGQNSDSTIDGDAVYVYLSDGGVEAFLPSDVDGNYYTDGDFLCFPMKSGDVIYYASQEYDSISTVAPALPELTSYKFNNKYNPTLFVDVEAAAIEDNIYLPVNAIGKWLTASFQVSDDKAVAYVGDVLQESKVTRQSFASPVTYTVTYPGYNRVNGMVKVQDAVWEYSGGEETAMALTADMLSTNKPSTSPNEGVSSLLDGSSFTIFHSTWGSANDATIDVDAYIDVALPVSAENIKLYYQCRQQSGYNPLVLELYGGNDNGDWELVRTLTTADGMPTGGSGQQYNSPVIPFGTEYSKLRILQTSGEYSKNHMALSEMRLYEVSGIDSVLVSDAVYETKRVPFGRNYNVEIDWLTDNAISAPRIDIDIEGGLSVTSKETYLNANFRITGYGVYDNFEDSVQVKGRGNITWSYAKKPYRLKFADKVKPFGLTKGKSWVLLANAQEGSMLANAAAMKIGQMVGAQFTNHIIPVELYMNGVYMGSYMFSEHVSMSNNSVDVDEEVGYLLELDSYYDEDYKFKSTYYSMPVNVKEPDLTEYTKPAASDRLVLIRNDFNALDTAVYHGNSLDDILDYDAFARFMLTNDLVNNQEIGHPKSTYLFKEELENPESKIKFGPLWDFDWAFGYESTGNYCTSDYTSSVFNYSMSSSPGYRMFKDMMSNSTVQKHYYKVWTEFLDKNSLAEFNDYMDSYVAFANSSFQNNYILWGDGDDYANICGRTKSWIGNRAVYIYDNLTEYGLDEFLYPLVADVNKNNYVTVHDVAITTAYLNSNTHKSFTYSKADVDSDGFITNSDLLAIESAAADADVLSAMDYYNTPLAIGELYVNNFELVMNEDYQLPLNLNCYGNENYKAMQLDITVPDGVMIFDAAAAGSLTDHRVSLTQRDMTTYRLIIYSGSDSMFATGDGAAVVNLTLNSYAVVPEEERVISISNVLAVDEATEELRLNDVAATFGVATNIYDVAAPTASVKGGDGCITIAALTAQQVYVYGVDGRVVRSLNVPVGTTRVELPTGIYVVLGSKVVVR